MNRDTAWTEDAIRDLGAFTTLPTAAQIFGLSRNVAYAMAAAGTFPVPVLKVSARVWRVPVGPILAAAGFTREHDAPDVPDATEDAGDADLITPLNRASISVVKSPAHPPRRKHPDGR